MMTVKMKFAYADDSTRLYSLDCDDSLAADVKDNIIAVNSSLRASTDGGLSSFFVSDGGSNFSLISGATLESSTVQPLTIAPNT